MLELLKNIKADVFPPKLCDTDILNEKNKIMKQVYHINHLYQSILNLTISFRNISHVLLKKELLLLILSCLTLVHFPTMHRPSWVWATSGLSTWWNKLCQAWHLQFLKGAAAMDLLQGMNWVSPKRCSTYAPWLCIMSGMKIRKY